MLEIDALIKQGQSQLAEGDAQAATHTFTLALERAPASIQAYSGRAKAKTMLCEFESALEDLNQVLAMGVEYPAFFDQRGQLYTQMGKRLEALEDFRRALELEPNSDRHYRYGLTLSSLRHYGEALPYLEKAVELEPNHAKAITERGMVRMELGRLELAGEDFDRAVRVDPNYQIAWLNRAAYHYRRQEWQESVTNADRAIELARDYAPAYKLRALAEKELGQIEKAVADLKQFLALNSQSSERPYIENLLKKLNKAEGRQNWLARWFKFGR